MNLLRNKTKRQKLLGPEQYTFKIGVTSAKSIEKFFDDERDIYMAMCKLNFLIGYKQSFVCGKTLNKWTISFH